MTRQYPMFDYKIYYEGDDIVLDIYKEKNGMKIATGLRINLDVEDDIYVILDTVCRTFDSFLFCLDYEKNKKGDNNEDR